MELTITCGDSLEELKKIESNSIDSLICDPPCGIQFMGCEWDSDKGGMWHWVDWLAEVLTEARRVLKPGSHGAIWALPRTSHWTGLAIEKAGFEVRDKINHVFGSGFPKNHDVSKAIDKAAGAEREVVEKISGPKPGNHGGSGSYGHGDDRSITAPATDAAKQWEGWGTALKPSNEDWWIIRKPFKGSIANCVLENGTGAINVDGCRVGESGGGWNGASSRGFGGWGKRGIGSAVINKGRWPSNIVFTHSALCGEVCVEDCPLMDLDEQSGTHTSVVSKGHGAYQGKSITGFLRGDSGPQNQHGDTGGASRFFPTFRYQSKPSRSEKEAGLDHLPLKRSQKLNEGGLQKERDEKASAAIESQGLDARGRTLILDDGSKTLVDRFIPQYRANNHPTVKPIEFMRWLCRLLTPPGGTILDPFMGSGTTGCGAVLEGFNFHGIDLNPEYCEVSRIRINYWESHGKQQTSKNEEVGADGKPIQMGLF